MRKAKSDRWKRLRQQDLRRFPLPPWAEWYDAGMDQVLFPVYGASGAIAACSTAIIIDTRFPFSWTGDFGMVGLHSIPEGRWFRMDFFCGPRRHSLRQVKQALRMMEGAARG